LKIDLDFKYKDLIQKVKEYFNSEFDLGVILGSGLGNFTQSVDIVKSIETSSLPNYPLSTVDGHRGYIHFAKYKDKNLLLFQGRIHFYEGYKIYEVLLPVFIAYKLGVKKLFLSNAAGGINPNFVPGDLMYINDYMMPDIKKNIAAFIGTTNIEYRNSMLNFPDASLKEKLFNAALNEKIRLKEGVYYYTKGPSYETPSEIRWMRKIGADAVGMSTAHEALFAKYLGIETAAVSLITNYAAGISPNKLSHAEVIETADKAANLFERLLKKFIETI